MSEFYKLDENKNAIPCSLEEWANQLEEMRMNNKKHVSEEMVGNYWVSTVWLGLNHQFGFGRPLLFETMVFDHDPNSNRNEIYMNRYSTWQEAEEGHKKAVKWVKNGCKEEK